MIPRVSVTMIPVAEAAMPLYKTGHGPALLFLHGWPFHGATFRHLIPFLENYYTCYVVDLPGLGASQWEDSADLGLEKQVKRVRQCIASIGLSKWSILAHNSGGTIARLLAADQPDGLERIVLLNTEIPGVRPPWLTWYQRLFVWPGSSALLSYALRSRWLVGSRMGFGGCFYNQERIDRDFMALYLDPIIRQPRRAEGARKYLLGFDWSVVDTLRHRHADIRVPITFIWGEDDSTFPLQLVEDMRRQFSQETTLHVVPRTKLLVHEENPEAVAAYVRAAVS